MLSPPDEFITPKLLLSGSFASLVLSAPNVKLLGKLFGLTRSKMDAGACWLKVGTWISPAGLGKPNPREGKESAGVKDGAGMLTLEPKSFVSYSINCCCAPSDSCTCGLRSFTHWKDCASLHPLDFIKKAITNAADLLFPDMQCTRTRAFSLSHCSRNWIASSNCRVLSSWRQW